MVGWISEERIGIYSHFYMASKLCLFLHYLPLISLFPSPFFSSSSSSLFSPPPLLKAKWWIWTSWHCLNSLTHLVLQDTEHCLARLKCFPSTLLLETMEVLWLTSSKQYLSQAYGHVLLWILPAGAVLVLCKEQELVGRGSTLCSSLKRTKGVIQSFYLLV